MCHNPLKYTDLSGETTYSTSNPAEWYHLLSHLAAGKDLDSFKPYGWDVHNEDGDYLGVYSYNDVTGMGYVQSVSYGGGNKVKLPDGSYILPTLTITSTRYNLKTGFDPRAIREASGGYEGDASALDIAATTVGAIGFELGALEAGWRLSSNKSNGVLLIKYINHLKAVELISRRVLLKMEYQRG